MSWDRTHVVRLLFAVAGAGGWFAAPSVAQITTAPIDTSQTIAADLQQLAATLNDPAGDARARDEAARRIVSRQDASSDAKRLISNTLVNANNPRGQLSMAKALAQSPVADPALIDPLFALIGPDRPLAEAAAEALTGYKSVAVVQDRLIDLLRNPGRETTRASVASALGSFPDKRVARTLLDTLRNEAEPAVVRNAAADALAELTGLTENNRDAVRWNRWWAEQSGKPDEQFRDELLAVRSARLDRVTRRETQLADELTALLADQYQSTNDGGKDALLAKWLRSNEPRVRQAAAKFVEEDFAYLRSIGQPIRDQVRAMIGDSSPAVRLQVARTLRTYNDTAALEGLLTQLAQEPVAENRAAVALALGSIRDVRAIPRLQELLNEGEPTGVAEAAAAAIAQIGPTLREREPGLARDVAANLRRLIDRRTQPGDERLRESLVEALVPLRDAEALNPVFFRLLNLRESERVRRACLRGIAELKEERASDTIVGWIKTEPVASVRAEAILTLGATSRGSEHFETLYQRMQPAVESDATARANAWRVFSSLLPSLSTDQINRWTGRFQGDPDKRVVVLKSLADKLQADRKLNDLAVTRQSIGEALMRSTPPQSAEAATHFRAALDFFRQDKATPGSILEKLNNQVMESLMASRQYAELAKFASDLITRDSGSQQDVFRAIRMEAERLRDANDTQNALKLLAESKTMTAPLAPRLQQQLDEIGRDIQNRASVQKGGSQMIPPAAPSTAS